MGRSRQLSLNKFFDPSAPSMRKVDDGKKKKRKEKKKEKKIMLFLVATRHAKRLFLSGNRDMDSEMPGQFIWTNLLNKWV